jgi:RNA polymerase sigma-70 factor (ECF subfamily)
VAFTVQAPDDVAQLVERAPERPPFEGDEVDVDLIRAAQAGDLRAFASLYDRHRERLVRFCRSRLGDADDAADAGQETFLRAWRSLDTFGNRGNVYPWLHAIARNVCTDILRKRLRVEPSDDQMLGSMPDTGITAHELLDAEADTALLRTAFDRLSDRHREILTMREYEGWTYERIADEEQLELNAVKSLLWRARQSLRREFLLLTDGGRLGGIAGIGVLLRGSFPTVRGAFDRAALTIGDLASATTAAVGNAGVAAAGAVSVAAVVVTMGTAAPPPSMPPAPAPVVVSLAAPVAPEAAGPGSTGAVTGTPVSGATATTTTAGAPATSVSSGDAGAPATTPAITVPESLPATDTATTDATTGETSLAPATGEAGDTVAGPTGAADDTTASVVDATSHGKSGTSDKVDKSADRGNGKKK